MGITTYTRKATCSDCKYCKSSYDIKKKTHNCTNPESERHTAIIRLSDLVCEVWKLS